MALESNSVFREFAMTSALRPLFAACLLTVLSAPIDAKTKHKTAVNGALSNLPAFTQTYACKTGQPMFKPDTEQTALWR
jgi:predicted metalloendopeptidase